MLPARKPYPDELTSSAVFRCSRQFNAPLKRLGRIALGRVGWRPSFLGATPLRELSQLFRLSPEDLLWNHTTFPYATAAMQRRYYENAHANAYGSAHQLVGLGAVTQNVTAGLAYRRYCEDCASEEWERFRESYWHRSHNLPGVWTCARHHAFLRETSSRVSSYVALDKALPHECNAPVIQEGAPAPAFLNVTRLSTSWLARPRLPPDVMRPSAYRQLAIANDWLSVDRPVSLDRLRSSLLKTFGHRFLLDAGLPPEQPEWALLILQPAVELPFTPAKHAIMQSLLSMDRPSHCARLDHISSGPSGSDATAVDRFYASAARRRLKAVIAGTEKLTTEQFLRSVGCWGAYKHRKHELPKLRAVVREFRGSAATVKRLRAGKTLFRSERSQDLTG